MYQKQDTRPQFKKNNQEKQPNKNNWIRAKEVLLIDQDGEMLGNVTIQEALNKAKEAGLDLVEVGPNAKPPVCKIIDYSKYLYELKRKQRKSKKSGKVKSMKEFKFSPVIEEHDAEHRIKRAKEYLSKGHQVRLSMFRKGRQSKEQAEATFNEILTKFDGYSSIEPEPKSEGRKIFLTFKPSSNGKSKKTEQNSKDSNEKVEENKPEGE